MAAYDIEDDDDLKSKVRGLTLYEDTQKELPSTKLDKQLEIAKMRVHNVTGSDEWYDDSTSTPQDRGLAQALLGTTAILAKAAVENYSVSGWNVGSTDIDVSGAGDEEQAQFTQWAEMVSEGLKQSDVADTSSSTPHFTNTHIHGYD